MKTNYFLFIFFLLLCACDNTTDFSALSNTSVNSRSTVNRNSLFVNVDAPDMSFGPNKEYISEFYIEGYIYCPVISKYDFIIGADGNSGRYEIRCGTYYYSAIIASAHKIKRVSCNLNIGYNKVTIYVNNQTQGGVSYIRFLIDKINGRSLSTEEGSVDLSIGGTAYPPQQDLGSIPSYFRCPKCGSMWSYEVGSCPYCNAKKDSIS